MATSRNAVQGVQRLSAPAAVWLPRVGVLLLALAAVAAGHSWWGDHELLHATATVTENVGTFAPGGGVSYSPRLRFRTPSGEIQQVLAAPGSSDAEFAPGASVPVAWPAGEPQRAGIATVWRVYRTAIWLGIWGTVLFDLGWLLRLRAQRP
jgi:hypothetical protein